MDDKAVFLLVSRFSTRGEYISIESGDPVLKADIAAYKFHNPTHMLVSNDKNQLEDAIKIMESDLHKSVLRVYNEYHLLKPNEFINVNPTGRTDTMKTPGAGYIKGDKLRICYSRHTDDVTTKSRTEYLKTVEKIVCQIPNFKRNLEKTSIISSPSESSKKVVSDEKPKKTETKKIKKETIPNALKLRVFNKHFGRDVREGKCFCCKARITSDSFSCAHVIPEKYGGELHENNLRPVCVTCNSTMGTMLLHEYMVRQGYDLPETDHDEMCWIWLAKAMVQLEKVGERKEWPTKKDKNEFDKLTNPKKDIRVRLDNFAKAFAKSN